MSQSETRDLRVSSNIIYHLVFSQAGTIGKALAELAMNALDAKSDRFDVSITVDGFEVRDYGKGFRDRGEIESWFEELGFSHDTPTHQAEGRLGRFGLGRAQIMAFAPTRWETTEFAMEVDIKNKGLGYELFVDQPTTEGCVVKGKWYEPLSFSDLSVIKREFAELIAYLALDVSVDGEKVSKSVEKWDVETDEVCIKRKETGPLQVYNLGVLVRSYSAYDYGSGIVVSKVPFELNMARNDVLQSTCPVWKKVRKFLADDAGQRARKKTKLSDADRQLLINQLADGQIDAREVWDSPLLEDVSGRKWRLSRLVGGPVTIHTSGPKLAADRIQQSKQAFVLNKSMIEAFGCENEQALIEVLDRVVGRVRSHTKVKWYPIAELMDVNNGVYRILLPKELSPIEKAGLSAIKKGAGDVSRGVSLSTREIGGWIPHREIVVGESDEAHAWTDGKTFIAINRKLIRTHVRDGYRGFMALASVIVHEYLHEGSSAQEHGHDDAFFQDFHDVICNPDNTSHGTGVRKMHSHFIKVAGKAGLKFNRNELRDLDREIAFEESLFGESPLKDEVAEAI